MCIFAVRHLLYGQPNVFVNESKVVDHQRLNEIHLERDVIV